MPLDTYQTDATGFMGAGPDPYSPSPAAQLQRIYQAQLGMDQMRRAAMMDNRTMGLANLFSQTFMGQPLSSLQANNPLGYGMLMNIGGLLNGMGALGNGSPMSLHAGIQRAVAHGNFMVQGMNPAMAQPLYGNGGLTQQFATQMFQGVQDYFYTPSGGQRLDRTAGFNRSEMGAIFNEIQQSGGFAGTTFQYHKMNLGELRAQANRARKLGDMKEVERIAGLIENFSSPDASGNMESFVIPPQQMEAINKKVESWAKSLSGLRDVFGGMAFQDLRREAERLTGMNMSDAGGPESIARHIASVRNVARAYGADERYMLENVAAGAQMVGLGRAWGARPGQLMALETRTALLTGLQEMEGRTQEQVTRQALAAQGIYVPERDVREAMGRRNQVAGQVMARERFTMGALVAMDITAGVSADQRAEVEGLVAQLGQTTDPDERRRLRAAIQERVQQATGMSPEQMMKGKTPAEIAALMSERSRNVFAEMGVNSAQAGLANEFTRLGAQMGLGGGGGKGLNAFFTTFGSSQGKLIEAAMSGGVDAVAALINDPAGLGQYFSSPAERENFIGMMRDLESSGGGRSLGQILTQAQALMSTDRKMADVGVSSREGRTEVFRRRAEQWVNDNRFGGGSPNLGVLDLFAEGLLGGGNVSDQALMAYAKESGMSSATLHLSTEGGMTMTPENYDMLRDLIKESGGTGLAGLMGVSTPQEAVDLLKKPEGLVRFTEGLQKLGMKGVFQEDGTFAILSRPGADKGVNALNSLMQEKLFGADLSGSKTEMMDLVKKRIGVLSLEATNDNADDRGELFKAFIKQNSEMMLPMLAEEAQRLEEKARSSTDAHEKSALIGKAEAIKKLHTDMQKGGGGNYIGYVTIKTSDTMGVQLYSSVGDAGHVAVGANGNQ